MPVPAVEEEYRSVDMSGGPASTGEEGGKGGKELYHNKIQGYHQSTLQPTNLQTPHRDRYRLSRLRGDGFGRLNGRHQSHAILLEGHALDDDQAGAGEGRVEHSLPSETTSAASTGSLKTKSNSFLESDDGVGVHDESFIGSEFLSKSQGGRIQEEEPFGQQCHRHSRRVFLILQLVDE
jgi:hypothetical protein